MVSSFIEDLFNAKKFETWGLEKNAIARLILSEQPASCSEICALVLYAYAIHREKTVKYWGDKNNFYIHYVRELIGLYPGARFLHVVRDGRDVACSYRDAMRSSFSSPYAPRLSSNISEIAHDWSRSVLNAKSSLKDVSHSLTVRYEDLVTSPDSVLAECCGFLDISYEPGMLNFCKENRLLSLEPEQTMGWKKKTLLPVDSEGVGRYLRDLRESEIRIFNLIAKEALLHFSCCR